MALLKVICWALIFIIRIRFPPGKSLATIGNNMIIFVAMVKIALYDFLLVVYRINERLIHMDIQDKI